MQYKYEYVYKVYSGGGHGYQEETFGYFLDHDEAKKCMEEDDFWRSIEPIKLNDYGGKW